MLLKTDTSENGFKSRDLKTHRFQNASFVVWTGKTESFENGAVQSVT